MEVKRERDASPPRRAAPIQAAKSRNGLTHAEFRAILLQKEPRFAEVETNRLFYHLQTNPIPEEMFKFFFQDGYKIFNLKKPLYVEMEKANGTSEPHFWCIIIDAVLRFKIKNAQIEKEIIAFSVQKREIILHTYLTYGNCCSFDSYAWLMRIFLSSISAQMISHFTEAYIQKRPQRIQVTAMQMIGSYILHLSQTQIQSPTDFTSDPKFLAILGFLERSCN